MNVPKFFVYGVTGVIMFESFFPDDRVHTHNEKFSGQNMPWPATFVAGTTAPSGSTIFISGAKAIT